MNRFEIVAHRGIPTEAPENTLASFQRAIELGADAVELDVRLTSDKVPVVFHRKIRVQTAGLSQRRKPVYLLSVNQD